MLLAVGAGCQTAAPPPEYVPPVPANRLWGAELAIEGEPLGLAFHQNEITVVSRSTSQVHLESFGLAGEELGSFQLPISESAEIDLFRTSGSGIFLGARDGDEALILSVSPAETLVLARLWLDADSSDPAWDDLAANDLQVCGSSRGRVVCTDHMGNGGWSMDVSPDIKLAMNEDLLFTAQGDISGDFGMFSPDGLPAWPPTPGYWYLHCGEEDFNRAQTRSVFTAGNGDFVAVVDAPYAWSDGSIQEGIRLVRFPPGDCPDVSPNGGGPVDSHFVGMRDGWVRTTPPQANGADWVFLHYYKDFNGGGDLFGSEADMRSVVSTAVYREHLAILGENQVDGAGPILAVWSAVGWDPSE